MHINLDAASVDLGACMHENLDIPYFISIVCTFVTCCQLDTFVTCRSLLFGNFFFSNLHVIHIPSQILKCSCMHLISFQNNVTNSWWFLHTSQKMMQTQVCKGSNHMFVIPQEKEKKCYTHVYPSSIDVSMKLDLTCA